MGESSAQGDWKSQGRTSRLGRWGLREPVSVRSGSGGIPLRLVGIAGILDPKNVYPDRLDDLLDAGHPPQPLQHRACHFLTLAYKQDTKAGTEEAALWFLKNYEDLWTGWVPADVAKKVKAAMK